MAKFMNIVRCKVKSSSREEYLKKISYTNFNYKVNISKQKYVRMIRERYISCLLNMSNKEIKSGISEIKFKYKNQIKFTDTLKCVSYRK